MLVQAGTAAPRRFAIFPPIGIGWRHKGNGRGRRARSRKRFREAAMKFGFGTAPVGPKGASDEEVYEQSLADCELGVELGFDSAWALEHHFTPYFFQPDTIVFMSHLAARFPTLGLGTCVIVLPWHNPLRLAGQIAMLNNLSKGELYLGIGRGTARYEFDRLGVDMAETRPRFRESLEIIRLALKGDPFEYKGEIFTLPETQVRPRASHPERIHFFGAIGSPASAEIMAELGIPILQGTNFPDMYAERFVNQWKARAAEVGLPTDNVELPVMALPTILAETDKEALALANKYFPIFTRVQMDHYETLSDYWKDVPGYEQFSKMFANLAKLKEPGPDLDKFLALQLVGSPDTVIKRIQVMRETFDVGHVASIFGTYEMEYEVRRRSMKLFAEHVIPHFRQKAAA
jgi:alkanesulfonate monooxygenase SsuD/methylene tetrahydromethanopterin reductase-like flavin-dependent oxidoreductase (luciferase family)